MNGNGLELENIRLGYGQKPILRIDKATFPSTGMVFITGPSGAGKSTLLEALGLMTNSFIDFEPAKSKYQLQGKNLNPPALWKDEHSRSELRRNLFSFIFQATNLMPNFTVGENIKMPADSALTDGDLNDKIDGLLRTLDLPTEILNKAPYHISGGQKQRIAFARAMVSRFSVIFADEPTGNLDLSNSINLFGILREFIHSQKKLAVIVTHHLDLAKRFGDCILEIIPQSDGVALARMTSLNSVSQKSDNFG